ncbi:unnamed protein product [Urochloa humidicola]
MRRGIGGAARAPPPSYHRRPAVRSAAPLRRDPQPSVLPQWRQDPPHPTSRGTFGSAHPSVTQNSLSGCSFACLQFRLGESISSCLGLRLVRFDLCDGASILAHQNMDLVG